MSGNPALSGGLALIAGILSALSPCVLPILPLVVGRSLMTHRYGPLVLTGGLIVGFASLGSLLGVTATWFTVGVGVLRGAAIGLLLVLGFLAIFPHGSDRLFAHLHLPWKSAGQPAQNPTPSSVVGEFWVGMQLGFLWTPCAGPVLGSILVLAAVERDIARAFPLLFLYGLGTSLPLLAIAYGGRYVSQHVLKLRPYSPVLRRVGGVAIVAAAIAISIGADIKLQLWLAPLIPPIAPL